ncbi:MAG: lipopolysaccharide 1,2-N-acetylglucosaminetransferase [Cycloclasticus sp.]|nr:lipopolysaccharide 1,2-N-acetylglucosaminetransferase [Cycloclasticus sp.]MBG97201.1 lipopolysaccharide 1,2-N-acetylglucosaminetransferase [Cycloclasticus sp.]|tara:strand:- start:1416 stop:2402 length:987 start_codon:yes stop_codon:yes gene_type:complete
MAAGNGAHVVHKSLEKALSGYKVASYHPYRTLFPPGLWSVGKAYKADIFHAAPDYALFHAKKGVPLVLTFHNYVLDAFMRAYSSPLQNLHYQTDLKWFTKKSVNLASSITAVSRFTAGLVAKELVLKKPINVIYNGIDEAAFKPVKKIGNRKRIRVLFSGNLTKRKGVHWIMPILNKLNTNIEIVYTAGLRGQGDLGAHSRLVNVGRVEYSNMPQLYQSVDVLLFPTVREGFGLAASEAMACGLPVVATNCSSLPELIDEGKGGFLCGLGDVNDFAVKINLLAENEALRREMGDYNRDKVERLFTLKRMMVEYQHLFESVCDGFSYSN